MVSTISSNIPVMVDRFTDRFQEPIIVRIKANLYAAVFRLMKLIPAKYVIERALMDGRLQPGGLVAETSSGTYALGLGMVCAENRLNFHIFSDPAIDGPLKARLEELGGTIHLLTSEGESGANLQILRLNALHDFLKSHPSALWPQQYDNSENRDAYGPTGNWLARLFPDHLTLVASVGSGGSSCGTALQLRQLGVDTRLVGVDTFGSVLFGLDKGRRELRGLGNAIHPGNLAHNCFDEVHWLGPQDAYLATRLLHRETSIFGGPTTGAAYHVAEYLAAQTPNRPVVFIAPDEGYRYQHTVYNDLHLRERGFFGNRLTSAPSYIPSLSQVRYPWSALKWARRSLADIHALAETPAHG